MCACTYFLLHPQAPMDMFTDTSVCWENKKLFSMVFTHRILKPIENGGQSSKCPLLSLFICVCMCVHMWEDRMTASGAILRNDIHLLQDRACPDWSPLIRLTSLAIWDPMASSYPALVSLAQATTLSIFTRIPTTQPRASCFWKEHLLISLSSHPFIFF